MYYTQEERERSIDEFDDFVMNVVFMFIFLALFSAVMPRVIDFIFVEEKYVTTETVLSPGDLAISGTRYVGVIGNTVEFEEGDKTMKYGFEADKDIKLRENRTVRLKNISGDNLTISERRLVSVNKFTDVVLD